jgi:hypothetical protein
MKKLLALLAISGSIIACNNSSTSTETTTDTASKTVAPADNSAAAAPAKDSLMQFKGGKVLISLKGAWSDLSATVTTSNGRTVNPNGEVSKNGKTRKLEEGMMIDKDGQLMDKDGKLMDNTGWE